MRTALLVVLIVVASVSFAAETDQDTKDLKAALAEQQKVIAEQQKTIAALEKRVSALEAKQPAVENPRPLDARVAEQERNDVARVSDTLRKCIDTQEVTEKGQNLDITALAKNLNSVETRVKYHTDVLKQFNEIITRLTAVEKNTASLREEAKALKSAK